MPQARWLKRYLNGLTLLSLLVIDEKIVEKSMTYTFGTGTLTWWKMKMKKAKLLYFQVLGERRL
jgi:hypothetical protein